MVLGNHEFDFGPDVLTQRLVDSSFTTLAANVMMREVPVPGPAASSTSPPPLVTQHTPSIDASTLIPLPSPIVFPGVAPSFIKRCDMTGIAVGFFGVTTPMTPALSYPGPTVSFAPLVATARVRLPSLLQETRSLYVCGR